MNDKEFFELKLKTLFPSASAWPSEYVHQKALLAATNECTALVGDAYAQFDKVDADGDLTADAKTRQKAQLASLTIGKLENSKALTRAREAAERVLQKYETQINSNLKPATNSQSVGVHAQIRGQLLATKDPRDRMSFFGRNGNDLTLISAALSAPAYVSGRSDAEIALLRKNLEQHAALLPPPLLPLSLPRQLLQLSLPQRLLPLSLPRPLLRSSRLPSSPLSLLVTVPRIGVGNSSFPRRARRPQHAAAAFSFELIAGEVKSPSNAALFLLAGPKLPLPKSAETWSPARPKQRRDDHRHVRRSKLVRAQPHVQCRPALSSQRLCFGQLQAAAPTPRSCS